MMNEKIEETKKYEDAVKSLNWSDLSHKRPPAKTCIFCDKSLEEVGGKRLVAQKLRGVSLSNQYKGGGNPDFPYQSVKLFDDLEVYITVWGEKSLLTQSAIDKAKNEFLTGYQPWFCQICGNTTCVKCGSPLNNPAGSDILHSDGSSSHAPIFAGGCGCINPRCEKYQ